MSTSFVLLAAVVLAGFTVEAALGFGATIVVVALGSLLVPIESILPAFVPLNVVLSLAISFRQRRDIDRDLLGRRIVPAMVLGIPFGLVAFRVLPAQWLARAFAVFVLVLGSIELRREFRAQPEAESAPASAPIAPWMTWLLLFVGGVIHGAFATGGPMAVYVAGRLLADHKARFRATLSALWLVLNAVVLAGYVALHRVTQQSLRSTAMLALPLVLGMLFGEWLHHRVPMKVFRRGVFVLLTAAGVVLLLRA